MTSRDVLSRSGPPPDAVVRYGAAAEAVIDLFEPRVGDEDPPTAATPSPLPGVDSMGDRPPSATASERTDSTRLVVFFHGGFWRTEWDRVHARPLAWALAAAGLTVAVPEYRRGPGSWPDMAHDVSAVCARVRSLVVERLPGLIDPDAAITLCGHSAGGQLALWAGLHCPPGDVGRVVALAPVTDLAYAARTGMGEGAVTELLGDPAPSTELLASADPAPLLPGNVAVTVIQGDADEQVGVQMNRAVAARLGGAGSFEYVELAGTDHFALIDPESAAWPTVLTAIAGLRSSGP